MVTGGILVVLIPNLDLNFWNSDPKIQYLGKFCLENSKLSVLPKNSHTRYLEDADSYSNISFLNFQPWVHFWEDLGPGIGIACFIRCSYVLYLECPDLLYLKSLIGEDNEEGLQV